MAKAGLPSPGAENATAGGDALIHLKPSSTPRIVLSWAILALAWVSVAPQSVVIIGILKSWDHDSVGVVGIFPGKNYSRSSIVMTVVRALLLSKTLVRMKALTLDVDISNVTHFLHN